MTTTTARRRSLVFLAIVTLLVGMGGVAPAGGAEARAGGPEATADDAVLKGRPLAAAASCTVIEGAYFCYAAGQAVVGTGTAHGASADITVHRPVLYGDYHSLAELAVTSFDGEQVVEVGWTVDKGQFGDTQPRLFVFSWVDGEKQCYNGCGFVRDSPYEEYATPGQVLPVGSTQWFSIRHETNPGRWWISLNGMPFGYFPDGHWGGDFTEPERLSVFGEVSARNSLPCARMGAGAFPTLTSGAAISDVRFTSTTTPPPVNLSINSPTPDYYQAVKTSPNSMRYGGPGAFPATPPPAGSNCLVTVPYVRFDPVSVAADRIRRAGLVPSFGGNGTWVWSQSPSAGTECPAGSTVSMSTRSGPIP